MTSELIERARKTYNIQRRTARLRGELFHAVEIDPIDLRELITLASRASVGDAFVEAVTCLTWIAHLGYAGAPDIAMRNAAQASLEKIAALTQAIEGQAPA